MANLAVCSVPGKTLSPHSGQEGGWMELCLRAVSGQPPLDVGGVPALEGSWQ